MKKIAFALILILLFPVVACADVDLSGMSYDELVALKDQINLAIWNSKEWREVYVPQGVWEIGVDIPEGHWSIKPVEGAFTYIKYGSKIDESGTDISGEPYYGEFAENPTSAVYNEGSSMTQLDINLTEGHFLKISSGDVIFSPYSGKPSLGF